LFNEKQEYCVIVKDDAHDPYFKKSQHEL